MTFNHIVCGPVLYYEPGQNATIVFDSGTNTTTFKNIEIKAVYDPQFNLLQGFPAPMFELPKSKGIFVARFKLPSGSNSCGTYLCHVSWETPNNQQNQRSIYTIIIRTPSSGASCVGI